MKHLKNCLAIVALLGIFTVSADAFQDALGASPVSGLRQQFQRVVNDKEQEVGDWERQARFQMALVLTAGILGLIVGALQKSDKKTSRAATAALGAAMSALTLINSTLFETDHRTLRAKARKARDILEETRVQLAHEPALENLEAWSDEILNHLKGISHLREELRAARTPVTIHSTVNAEPIEPEWVSKAPEDDLSLYYVAKSCSPSLAEAKTGALEDAIGKAAGDLARRQEEAQKTKPAPADMQRLRAFVQKVGEVSRTHVAYDPGKKEYCYFVQQRLSRSLARGDVIRIFTSQTAAKSSHK